MSVGHSPIRNASLLEIFSHLTKVDLDGSANGILTFWRLGVIYVGNNGAELHSALSMAAKLS